jgi:hypothetical protein
MPRILRLIAFLLLGLSITSSATVAAVPVLRHATLAWLSDPSSLPSDPTDARVHYEGDAADFAAEVARLLPEAMAQVEAAHGRPFARQPVIAVFADALAFANANGAGSQGPVGTSFSGRVSLSPVLWNERRAQLRDILVHELSHAHLQGHLNFYAFGQIPSWFSEGLAVMVSGGGGAANVSEATARAAIRDGYFIEVRDHTGLLGYPFDPPQDRERFPLTAIGQHMIYRQAGLFVAHLRERDSQAFARFMKALMDGTRFHLAFENAYGESIGTAWRTFAAGM